MSFAALAGGADCGPVNPMAQLSKTFGQDRGVQQDHFAPQASSSRSGFRRPGPQQHDSLPSDASHFFQQGPSQAQHQQQPFDLTPLNRALSPVAASRSASSSPGPPAWAQAFSQQQQPAMGVNPAEQEAFRRAFEGGGGGGAGGAAAEWSGDFTRMNARTGGMEGVSRDVGGQQGMVGGGGMYAGAGVAPSQARLYGAGFGAPALSMNMRMGGGGAFPMQQQQHEGGFRQAQDTVMDTKQADWELAFSQQEQQRMAEDIVHQAEETSQRPKSPVLTDTQARDALARTAGALLDTVQSSEQQRDSAMVNDKFANSTFLDLMRKLRDGEVAVEGDKVVEQVGPSSTVDKGKGRANGWASEFREEEGRSGAAVPPTAAYYSSLAEFATAQQAYAQDESQRAQMVRELEQGYKVMADVWNDEDQTREMRQAERLATISTMGRGQFQGDGGGIAEDEIMAERTKEQMRMDTSVPLASAAWEEDFDASMISGGHAINNASYKRPTELSAQQKEWDALQNDWDNFEVTAAGFQPVASTSSTIGGYAFAQNNPFYQQHTTRRHSEHASSTMFNSSQANSLYASILQKEAAVQERPSDGSAWLALGIKQQENEREDMAIKALRQALSLDSTLGEAYLALAISYTNENDRELAYDALDKWVDALGTKHYAREVENYRDLFGRMPEGGRRGNEQHAYLTGLLIQLAQSRVEQDGNVDAEVQIGLGVLFNTSEEYEKAGDCFESALSVRPEDPLLFNRLGATFANSGKTELAIQYYLEALSIQPTYVRARYNLSVANMNLGQYEEAVQHLLTSLSIQENEAQLESGSLENRSSGVTSQTLWDSLNISLLHLHRSDLATMTADRNLQGLMEAFPASNDL